MIFVLKRTRNIFSQSHPTSYNLAKSWIFSNALKIVEVVTFAQLSRGFLDVFLRTLFVHGLLLRLWNNETNFGNTQNQKLSTHVVQEENCFGFTGDNWFGSDIFGPNRDVGCQVTVAGWRVATDGSLGRAAALTMLGSVFDLIFEMIHLKSPGVSGRFFDLRKHLGECLLDDGFCWRNKERVVSFVVECPYVFQPLFQRISPCNWEVRAG